MRRIMHTGAKTLLICLCKGFFDGLFFYTLHVEATDITCTHVIMFNKVTKFFWEKLFHNLIIWYWAIFDSQL